MTVNALAEKRGKLIAEAQRKLEGDVDAARLAEAEAMLDDADELRAQIERLTELEDRARADAKAFDLWRDAKVPAPNGEADITVPATALKPARPGGAHDIRSMIETTLRDGTARIDLDLSKVELERQLIEAGVESRDVTVAAQMGIPPAGMLEERALSVGTSNKGGATVPTYTERSFYTFLEAVGGIRRAGADTMTTTHGSTVKLPVLASNFTPSGTLETAEAGEVGATDPTVGTVDLGAFKYTGRIDHSIEILQDTAINLNRLIVGQIARVIAMKTEMRFASGTASAMPKGIINSPTAARTTTTAGSNTVAAADLTKTFWAHDSDMIEMGNISWMMNSQIYGHLIDLKDSDGRPLLTPSYIGGTPDMILGRRVNFNARLPGGLADNDIAIVCGDIRRGYMIRQVRGVSIQSSMHLKFDHQQIVFIGAVRMDGQIRDDRALRWIKIKA